MIVNNSSVKSSTNLILIILFFGIKIKKKRKIKCEYFDLFNEWTMIFFFYCQHVWKQFNKK